MWSLYFDPRFVDSVVNQAATWPSDLGYSKSCDRVSDILSVYERETDPSLKWEKPTKVFLELS